jgi:hypothetical protein
MWLLDTKTIKVKQFIDERKVPFYAILSHTWGDDEISFQDIQNQPLPLSIKEKAGYKKIESCCAKAAEDGFECVWIDTCCIDKTNSAELSEAINSMFRWYGNATVCYAYLVDVEPGHDPEHDDSQFRKSRWFTRGWTLQELLAPRSMVFLNRDWIDIGTKRSLRGVITDITQIDDHLDGFVSDSLWDMARLHSISAAQKMFWASRRETTKVEDLAYCLMGLFGINMPMIYGEGTNAFKRLQLEIIKSSEDHSIFVWEPSGSYGGTALAHSPKDFQYSNNIQCGGKTNSEFSMTNKGLKVTLPLMSMGGSTIAILNCYKLGENDTKLGIRLRNPNYKEENKYSRVIGSKIESFKEVSNLVEKSIYIQEDKFTAFEIFTEELVAWLGVRHHEKSVPIYRSTHCRGRFHFEDFENERIHFSDFEKERKVTRHMTAKDVYITRLEVGRTRDSYPVMLMFGEFPRQGSSLMKQTSASREHFAALVGFTSDSYWCDLLIPLSSHTGLEYASKVNWHEEARMDGGDRRSGVLPSGCAVRLALNIGIVGGEKGYLVEIMSEKNFDLVLMGSACCWPTE